MIQLDSELDSELNSELNSELRLELWSELNSELWSELDSELGSELDSELGSELYSERKIKIMKNLNQNTGFTLILIGLLFIFYCILFNFNVNNRESLRIFELGISLICFGLGLIFNKKTYYYIGLGIIIFLIFQNKITF